MVALLILALIVAVVLAWLLVKTLIGLVLFLVIAGLCSAAAQALVEYKRGLSFTVASGLGGALVGLILAKALRLPALITIGHLPILWTLAGSLIVVAAAKVVMPQRRRGRIAGGSARYLP